jgi:frataxin-like iron-binding protein CyaY
MLDESTFRRHADTAIDSLKRSLIDAEEDGGFEDPPAKFVVTPNTPVRQVWISALSTSFKLEWSDETQAFILPKTGETLKQVVARTINQHLGGDSSVSLE